MPETDGKPTIRTDASSPLLDCNRRFSNIEQMLERHDITIYGEHGTNGVVGDISQIKYQTGAVRFFAQALFGVVVTVITLVAVKALGL